MNAIDLTHTLTPETPTFDLDCGFKMEIACDYKDCTEPNLFRTQKLNTPAGIGTHMDSPSHAFPGARTIEKLELAELVTEAAVIKVEAADEKYLITPAVVEQFEKKNGRIKPGVLVIFYTGWERHWGKPEKYRNNLIFPSVAEATAKLLVERGIAGLGTDTLSSDAGGEDFPVHRAILGTNRYLVENIANAGNLPATGAKIFVMPMKIAGGTEAPVRLIALV